MLGLYYFLLIVINSLVAGVGGLDIATGAGQVYVQKSTRTTLPCRSAAVRGGELSQAVAPLSDARSLALEA